MTTNENLSVLHAIHKAVSTAGIPNMGNIIFVCVQHLLYTSVNLFQTIINMGAKPENIFVLGKQYSTSEIVAEKIHSMGIQLQGLTPLKKLGDYTSVFHHDVSSMWQNVQRYLGKRNEAIEAVIVLDDGGRCLEFIKRGILDKWPVIGIEQTTAGLFNPIVLDLHVPFIDVATCAAKNYLEADLIIEAIFNKITNILPGDKSNIRCGVIGIGVIGKSVVRKLVSMGITVFAYDKNKINDGKIKGALYADSVESLIKYSAYIFGCTGRDVTENLDLPSLIHENKFFISCTSEDREFLSLLTIIQQKINVNGDMDPLKDIVWEIKKNIFVKIVKGGFPVNFDHSGTCVPAKKIQLTRGLLLASLIQAINMLPFLLKAQAKGRVMLHPQIQKFVAHEWLKINATIPHHKPLLNQFNDIEWIIRHSGGTHYPSEYLSVCFSKEKMRLNETKTAYLL